MDSIKLPAWIPKLSFEKKETFLKLTILTCAAILCKLRFLKINNFFFCFNFQFHVFIIKIFFSLLYTSLLSFAL